jgi:hypothetical protein
MEFVVRIDRLPLAAESEQRGEGSVASAALTETTGGDFARLRRRIGRLVTSNYDISDRCNLRCEGCLFFAGDDYKRYRPETDLNRWRAFFRSEAERGVNFGYFAGAEPSLELERLRAAHGVIPNGVVFSNGLVAIPRDVDYRIHISLWGDDAASVELRGAGNRKAFANYAGDPRAVFVFTINAMNIDTIVPATRAVAEAGSTITFSLFSPTIKYADSAKALDAADLRYFRHRDDAQSPVLSAADMQRAGDRIEEARQLHPATVRYSPLYHSWITRPEGLYDLDEAGVATNCGNRLSGRHRHYNVDQSATSAKCCSPNLDCRDCRAYAMGYASYLKENVSPRLREAQSPEWLEVWTLWAELFLGDSSVAVAAALDRDPWR